MLPTDVIFDFMLNLLGACSTPQIL